MDKLNEMYEAWKTTNNLATEFQAFQAGLTAGAVSMRERAMAVVDVATDKNAIKNGIGALSDIPTE